MSKPKTWDWIQASGRVWKVLTDTEAGTVKAVNHDGVPILEHTGLSREAVELIETNFMSIVGTEMKVVKEEPNPMYA